jgi:hypothetical protein
MAAWTLTWVTYEIKVNLSLALHCRIYYNCDLLFNWDGIHLHLVTANKILTNLLKVMLNLNHYLLISITLNMSPHHKWAYAHYSPHLLSDERLWAHSCYKPPTSEEQVPPEEDYYDEFDEI